MSGVAIPYFHCCFMMVAEDTCCFILIFRRLLHTGIFDPFACVKKQRPVLVSRALSCRISLFVIGRDVQGLVTSRCSDWFLMCSARPSLLVLVRVDRAVLLFVFRFLCFLRNRDCWSLAVPFCTFCCDRLSLVTMLFSLLGITHFLFSASLLSLTIYFVFIFRFVLFLVLYVFGFDATDFIVLCFFLLRLAFFCFALSCLLISMPTSFLDPLFWCRVVGGAIDPVSCWSHRFVSMVVRGLVDRVVVTVFCNLTLLANSQSVSRHSTSCPLQLKCIR